MRPIASNFYPDQDGVLTNFSHHIFTEYEQDFEPFPDIVDQPLPPLTGNIGRDTGDISPILRRVSYPKSHIPTDYTITSSNSGKSGKTFRNSHRKAKPENSAVFRNALSVETFNIMAKSGSKMKKTGDIRAVREHVRGKENREVEPASPKIHNNTRGRGCVNEGTESEQPSSPDSNSASPTNNASGTPEAKGSAHLKQYMDEIDIKMDIGLEHEESYLIARHNADKKTKAESRLALVSKLRKIISCKQQVIYALQADRHELYVNCAEMQQDMVKMEHDNSILQATTNSLAEKLEAKSQEYNELKQKHDRKLSELTSRRKRPAADETNKALMEKIETQLKGFLFSKCKFVSNELQEANLGKLMWKYGDLPEEHRKDKDLFIATYSTHMKKVIFDRRSYIQTEYRKIYFKCKKKGDHFPTVKELTKCVGRDIETDEDYKIFMYYCEEFLGKMVGASEWSIKTCCFTTISGAIRQNTNDIPLISPSDEAFAVLVVDNCMDRWDNEDKDGGARTVDAPKAKKTVANGKYTATDGGQSKYGGWSPEGLKKFNELKNMNEEARNHPRCKVVEGRCLELLREKHKITGKSWAEHTKRNKSKKRTRDEGAGGQDQEEMDEVVAEMEMISDNDE